MRRILIAILPAAATLLAAFLFLTSPVLSAERCGEASWYGKARHLGATAESKSC